MDIKLCGKNPVAIITKTDHPTKDVNLYQELKANDQYKYFEASEYFFKGQQDLKDQPVFDLQQTTSMLKEFYQYSKKNLMK